MVSGPYATGAATTEDRAANLRAMNLAAYEILKRGHVPVIGVNLGPNRTYVGSLATLLWRRILQEHDHDLGLGEFTKVGLVTVVTTIVGATVSLWAVLLVTGG